MSFSKITNNKNLSSMAIPVAMTFTSLAASNCASTTSNVKQSESRGRYSLESGPVNADPFNKGLPAGKVSETFSEHLDRILSCYDSKSARKHPKGTLDLRFFVESTGSVSETTARGLTNKVEECVKQVVSSVSFPKSKNGEPVSVYVPVTFSRASR